MGRLVGEAPLEVGLPVPADDVREQFGERDRGVVLVRRPDDLRTDGEAARGPADGRGRRGQARQDDPETPAPYGRSPSGVAITRSSNGLVSCGKPTDSA